MQAATGNTFLLKKADGSPLCYIRQGALQSTTGSFVPAAWNSSGSLYFPDEAFSDDNYVRQVVFHETGHNWDTAAEYAPSGSEWLALSGWVYSTSSPGSGYVRGSDDTAKWWYQASHANDFSYDSGKADPEYGKTNPYEDFATSFEAYFLTRSNFLSWIQAASDKDAFMARFIDYTSHRSTGNNGGGATFTGDNKLIPI
jgi:hypothetical protein